MLKSDADRLERERSIAEATKGPNYSRLEQSIAATKADIRKHDAIATDHYIRARAGYYLAVQRGEVQRDAQGNALGFGRDAPGDRTR